MLPRTDKFGPMKGDSMSFDPSATTADWLAMLVAELRAFIIVVESLDQDSQGRYLCRDPRAGKLPGLAERWNKIGSAASAVRGQLSVPSEIASNGKGVLRAVLRRRPGYGSLDDCLASITFMFCKGETESAIEGSQVRRLRSLLHTLERETMSNEIDALSQQAARLAKFASDPHVRRRIESEALPAIGRLLDESSQTRKAWREAHPHPKEFMEWMQDPSSPTLIRGISSGEAYPTETDPTTCGAGHIGMLRAKGDLARADVAEWYYLVTLHDSCPAGASNPLYPDMRAIDLGEGVMVSSVGALSRLHTGIEHPDFCAPRFDAATVAVMIDRFEQRFGGREARDEQKTRTNADEPLSDTNRAVLEELRRVPVGEGLIAKQIVDRLKLRTPMVIIKEATFRSHVVPALKKHGMVNKRGVGYFIDPAKRPPG